MSTATQERTAREELEHLRKVWRDTARAKEWEAMEHPRRSNKRAELLRTSSYFAGAAIGINQALDILDTHE